MPRPKKYAKGIRKNIYIPEDLFAQWQVILWDPVHERVQHGAWSGLIVRLLRDELARIQKEEKEKQSDA